MALLDLGGQAQPLWSLCLPHLTVWRDSGLSWPHVLRAAGSETTLGTSPRAQLPDGAAGPRFCFAKDSRKESLEWVGVAALQRRGPCAPDGEAEPPPPPQGRKAGQELEPGCGILPQGAPGDQVLWPKPLLVLTVFPISPPNSRHSVPRKERPCWPPESGIPLVSPSPRDTPRFRPRSPSPSHRTQCLLCHLPSPSGDVGAAAGAPDAGVAEPLSSALWSLALALGAGGAGGGDPAGRRTGLLGRGRWSRWLRREG